MCSDLEGSSRETAICACPQWTNWGSWSGCECPTPNTNTAERTCQAGYNLGDTQPTTCVGDATKIHPDPCQPCPTEPPVEPAEWGEWSQWTGCTKTCHGIGSFDKSGTGNQNFEFLNI